MQWNKLLSVNWIEIFNNNVINDCYTFWSEVYKFKNAGGDFAFNNIS